MTQTKRYPENPARFTVADFADLGLPIIRVGPEAGTLSQWLREGLADAGFEVVFWRHCM
ncbi:hypothetical protein [Mesorhizobium sp.]|uniref:hypothetical protein n=1 Tax=Mesorhizobium sp. TaxID=1871066 RepID=UPI003519FFC8